MYTATDESSQRDYAVKVFKNADPKSRDLTYANEVAIMGKLKHQNLIRLVDACEAPKFSTSFAGTHGETLKMIVLEKARKYTLYDYIDAGLQLPEEVCRFYFKQMVGALGYLHEMGLAHRDIKPENVLFDEHFNLKIADFGLSESTTEISRYHNGTELYFSPQVHLRMDYYPKEVDLFAAGILLFMMLSGSPPFEKATPSDTFYKLLIQNKLVFWTAHGQNKEGGLKFYSKSFRSLIKRLLAFEADERLSV